MIIKNDLYIPFHQKTLYGKYIITYHKFQQKNQPDEIKRQAETVIFSFSRN